MAYEYPLNENPVKKQEEPECPYCFKVYPICSCLACPCCGEIVESGDFCSDCEICSGCCIKFNCPKE